jgi:maltose alpha-D-glucosyltransferase/alpha-amylase
MRERKEHWHRDAIVYAIDVRRFQDSNGDGIGDLAGVASRLEYLADLGVTCLWLLPILSSPLRDNGYDVTDYLRLDPRVGTMEDFLALVHRAGEKGIRILMDLPVNHTSYQHPWFLAARYDRHSRYRDYYVWSEEIPAPPDREPVLPGKSGTVWTYDEKASAYFHHVFYDFQPDLNVANAQVRREILGILDYWLSFGVAGFRIDAANHLVEEEMAQGPRVARDILQEMRGLMEQRRKDGVLLGEADEDIGKLGHFFGGGKRLNLLMSFLFSENALLALAKREAAPLAALLRELPRPDPSGQWLNFLRNLDEADLEQLDPADQEAVCRAFAPDPGDRVFGRGIRRRLAPMLGNDRARMELAFSLLLSFPGTPLIPYGDEIGMGEDPGRPERESVRLPMQWSEEANGGFSQAAASSLVWPALASGPFSYHQVNAARQLAEPGSFLRWVRQAVHARRGHPAFSGRDWEVHESGHPAVLLHSIRSGESRVLAAHNFAASEAALTLDRGKLRLESPIAVFGNGRTESARGGLRLRLPADGYLWLSF